METKKTTKREFFGELRTIVEDRPELVAFIDHELELIDKKASSRKVTLTKTQKENQVLIEDLYNELKALDRPVQIKEIIAQSEKFAQFSSSKVSALMTKLKNEGRVVRTEEKRVAFFKAV